MQAIADFNAPVHPVQSLIAESCREVLRDVSFLWQGCSGNVYDLERHDVCGIRLTTNDTAFDDFSIGSK
ncbi:hypothetical protein [Cognatiyoonia sp. IB215182]|uniref:hypothetical protein n=1 Tax=Cognatiyoonia sp. IB215182 TaxID=3097353 RepID=UPI002A23DFF3|nr:hypothetical protein [Cognatiyoonia sp. IB215182]